MSDKLLIVGNIIYFNNVFFKSNIIYSETPCSSCEITGCDVDTKVKYDLGIRDSHHVKLIVCSIYNLKNNIDPPYNSTFSYAGYEDFSIYLTKLISKNIGSDSVLIPDYYDVYDDYVKLSNYTFMLNNKKYRIMKDRVNEDCNACYFKKYHNLRSMCNIKIPYNGDLVYPCLMSSKIFKIGLCPIEIYE